MTGTKAAMLSGLLQQSRRDLIDIQDRHDPEAAALRRSMHPDLVLAALDERSEPDEQPDGEAKADAGGNG
jgi:hypothetical protein